MSPFPFLGGYLIDALNTCSRSPVALGSETGGRKFTSAGLSMSLTASKMYPAKMQLNTAWMDNLFTMT